MRVLNLRKRKDYERDHPDAAEHLRAWWRTAQTASWHSFNDVRQTYNTADQVGNRVIFNIKGGSYRLVTWVDYERGLVVLKWFGTHKQYDRGGWK